MADVQKQLFEVVKELRFDLISSFALANRVATGRTEEQIEAVATDHDAQLSGPWWIYALQDGRKPTRPDAPTGDPTLFEQIKIWCAAKGIDEKLAYPITRHIHKFGYPGTPGLIDKPLSDDNIDRVMNKQLGFMADIFQAEVSRSIILPKETVSQPVTA